MVVDVDDFGGLPIGERVALDGVRGVGQLHIVIFSQLRQGRRRQRPEPIELRLFLLDAGNKKQKACDIFSISAKFRHWRRSLSATTTHAVTRSRESATRGLEQDKGKRFGSAREHSGPPGGRRHKNLILASDAKRARPIRCQKCAEALDQER